MLSMCDNNNGTISITVAGGSRTGATVTLEEAEELKNWLIGNLPTAIREAELRKKDALYRREKELEKELEIVRSKLKGV